MLFESQRPIVGARKWRPLLTLAILYTLGLPVTLPVGAQDSDCGGISPRVVSVVLDASGIGSWNLLNPRDPVLLAQNLKGAGPGFETCLGRSQLTFNASNTDRSFLVRFTFDIEKEQKTIGAVEKELQGIVEKLEDLKVPILQTSNPALNNDWAKLDARSSKLSAELNLLKTQLNIPSDGAREKAAAVGQEEAEQQKLDVLESSDLIGSAFQTFQTLARTAFDDAVSDRHQCASLKELWSRVGDAEQPSVQDLALDLQEIRSAHDHIAAHLRRLSTLHAASYLFDLARECKPKNERLETCTYVLPVFGSTSDTVLTGPMLELLARQQSDGLLDFKVSFLDEQELPTNNTGYVQVGKTVKEPGTQLGWKFVAGVGWTYDPQTDPDVADKEVETFTPDRPYESAFRNHFPANARIEVGGQLGFRAKFNAALGWKEADLGSASDGEVKVSSWDGQIFTNRGVTFRLGKFTFAAPSDGIAVQEKGEGFQLRFRRTSLSHIVKQESSTGTADADDDDSEVTLFNLSQLPLGKNSVLRTLNLLALYGAEKREDQNPYRYWTAGFELHFGLGECDVENTSILKKRRRKRCENFLPPGYGSFGEFLEYQDRKRNRFVPDTPLRPFTAFAGSLAGYYSELDPEPFDLPTGADGNTPDDFTEFVKSRGTTGLLTLRFSRLQWKEKKKKLPELKLLRTWTIKLGYGTGDDPETATNDGYLGQTAGFSSGGAFLSNFGSRLEVAGSKIPAGLSNKTYLGVSYTEQHAQFLQNLTRLFEASDLVKAATTFSVHFYRFNEPVLDERDAGIELAVDLKGEAPRGITASLGASYFLPGEALETLFEDDPWVLRAGISIAIK